MAVATTVSFPDLTLLGVTLNANGTGSIGTLELAAGSLTGNGTLDVSAITVTAGTTATSTVSLPVDTLGTMTVNSGILHLTAGGTISTQYAAAAGATLELGGGSTYTMTTGASFSGLGLFDATDNFSALTVNVPLAVVNFELDVDHSTGLSGTGLVTITNDFPVPVGNYWQHGRYQRRCDDGNRRYRSGPPAEWHDQQCGRRHVQQHLGVDDQRDLQQHGHVQRSVRRHNWRQRRVQ